MTRSISASTDAAPAALAHVTTSDACTFPSVWVRQGPGTGGGREAVSDGLATYIKMKIERIQSTSERGFEQTECLQPAIPTTSNLRAAIVPEKKGLLCTHWPSLTSGTSKSGQDEHTRISPKSAIFVPKSTRSAHTHPVLRPHEHPSYHARLINPCHLNHALQARTPFPPRSARGGGKINQTKSPGAMYGGYTGRG